MSVIRDVTTPDGGSTEYLGRVLPSAAVVDVDQQDGILEASSAKAG